METEHLPVAARAEEWSMHPVRVGYRLAVLVLATTLASLLLGRGYGIDSPALAGAAPSRLVRGDWVSVPWQLVGTRAPHELQIAVDRSACVRVVRHEVIETPDEVRVTVWRRRTHPTCGELSVVVRLKGPLSTRRVVDGGFLATE